MVIFYYATYLFPGSPADNSPVVAKGGAILQRIIIYYIPIYRSSMPLDQPSVHFFQPFNVFPSSINASPSPFKASRSHLLTFHHHLTFFSSSPFNTFP